MQFTILLFHLCDKYCTQHEKAGWSLLARSRVDTQAFLFLKGLLLKTPQYITSFLFYKTTITDWWPEIQSHFHIPRICCSYATSLTPTITIMQSHKIGYQRDKSTQVFHI